MTARPRGTAGQREATRASALTSASGRKTLRKLLVEPGAFTRILRSPVGRRRDVPRPDVDPWSDPGLEVGAVSWS